MTTNKPEVLGFAWSFRQAREVVAARSTFVNQLRNDGVDLEPLIRLSDYEALQSECNLLRKHLQNLIDQTTPLEPVPGNPMWSRRIQLDEVIAERDQLRAECEKLRKDAGRYQWLMERGDDFQWENIIRLDIEDFPSRCAAIDAAMEPPR